MLCKIQYDHQIGSKETTSAFGLTAMPGTWPFTVPLRYDFVGVREVAVNVFHLERVSVANLVVCAAVVGGFYHDDITPWAAEIDGVALAGQLSPHQAER